MLNPEIKSTPASFVLLLDKEIPPEDQNNSSETRLCRVIGEIIFARG